MEIIKLIVPILAIYLLLRRRCNLGAAMTVGAAVLGLLYAVTPERMFSIGCQALFSRGALILFGSFYVIMLLENVLRVNGVLERLMNASRVVIPDPRVVMAMLPAFLGFLPSLGGALFSAPLVNKAAEGMKIGNERKLLINYWYRHVWEFFLPIYPSLLLAQQILNIPMRDFVTHGFIYTILAMLIGVWICFRDVSLTDRLANNRKSEPVSAKHYGDMVLALGPVVVIVLLVVFFHVSVIIATLGVLAVLMVWFRYNVKKLYSGMKAAIHVKTFSAVAGVLIFKEMLIQSGAINEIVAVICVLNVPPVIMIGLMAFITAWITGMPQAVVGIVFPLIALLDPGSVAIGVVAMVCANSGQMLSPMHLCLVVTRDYFKCPAGKVLLRVAQGEALLIAAALGIYFLAH